MPNRNRQTAPNRAADEAQLVVAEPATVPLESEQREAAMAALVELLAETLDRRSDQKEPAHQRAA